jgi:adenine-specific DNA glycosylase
MAKIQALLDFQRWLCVSAKTKCAICAVGFSSMAHNLNCKTRIPEYINFAEF